MKLELDDNGYKCPKCKGHTWGVAWCENPSCPNMPCCGRPIELCDCNSKNT